MLETLVCLKSNKYVYSCVVTKFGPEPMVDILDPSIFSFFNFFLQFAEYYPISIPGVLEAPLVRDENSRKVQPSISPFHHFTNTSPLTHFS